MIGGERNDDDGDGQTDGGDEENDVMVMYGEDALSYVAVNRKRTVNGEPPIPPAPPSHTNYNKCLPPPPPPSFRYSQKETEKTQTHPYEQTNTHTRNVWNGAE